MMMGCLGMVRRVRMTSERILGFRISCFSLALSFCVFAFFLRIELKGLAFMSKRMI